MPLAIQKLRAFAFVSSVVRAEYEPTRKRRPIVKGLLIAAGPRRYHQIPTHKRKRSSVAELHRYRVTKLSCERQMARPEGFEPPTLRSEV